MRRRVTVRAQREGGVVRKRRRVEKEETAVASSVSAACKEEEESVMISELGQLLGQDEAAAWWKEEVGEQPGDTVLADLLQNLAACDDEDERLSPIRHNLQFSENAVSALPNMAAKRKATRVSENKNAQAARLNRLRKKEYVRDLEGTVTRLSEDNQRLERDSREMRERVRHLEDEVRYLRAVLANDSALAALLSRLTQLGGVKLSTSLFLEREKKPDEHDYALPREESGERAPPGGGGVCLHVDQGNVSVEFCPVCASRAATASKI